ncbi:MAG: prolipoprotein diacylglyceryl transferase [Candidatus Hydrogenedentota bacterium]
MHPVLIDIGPFTLHSYGLMIATAFIVALLLCQRDAPRFGVPVEFISSVAFGGLLAGIIGARILHIVMFSQQYSWDNPLGWIAIWEGGLVFQGAMPVAAAFCLLYARAKGVAFTAFIDVLGPYIPLGHAIGRVGCFLNGCCYGSIAHDVPWAVTFPRFPSDPSETPTGSLPYLDHLQRGLVAFSDQWSLPVHPSQLYSMGVLLLLAVMLLLCRRYWRPFQGIMIPAYFTLYGVGRFVLEFFRGDAAREHFGGMLTNQQVFSFVFIAFGVGSFVYLYRNRERFKPAQPHASREGENQESGE